MGGLSLFSSALNRLVFELWMGKKKRLRRNYCAKRWRDSCTYPDAARVSYVHREVYCDSHAMAYLQARYRDNQLIGIGDGDAP